jgi:hypothetical protein
MDAELLLPNIPWLASRPSQVFLGRPALDWRRRPSKWRELFVFDSDVATAEKVQ